ncbi:chaperone modulator CbpM [Amphritea sp. 2_MG-2023]|uniref:chaperone modulator CbpM n=1 Tax=Amphritea TaxID=515417 RepID=UPI001C069885|nr:MULTISPECIES: chaperone modulator CbpM [Amphritea]MBU2966634.1 chaperone modulator CbpM [Amphritea atlantica]MDO6417507.1 chaperone modulator CbpM [Amphritea sp. 2_MG-2023]
MSDIVLKVSLQELCVQEGITETMVLEVVEHGIAEPFAGQDVNDWIFELNSVHWMKKAIRLYHDLDIDWVSVAIVIDLLKQKDALLRENACLKNQLDRFVSDVTDLR